MVKVDVVCGFCGCRYSEQNAVEVYVGSRLVKACPNCGSTEVRRVMIQ